MVDGPKFQRQSIALAKVVLTPIVLPNLPRGAKTATVAKKWAAADIDAKWAASAWAKNWLTRKEELNCLISKDSKFWF